MKNFIKTISILVMLISVTSSKSQTVQWAKGIGGTYFDSFSFVQVDDGGNVYVAGTFKGQVDFDPNSGTQNLNANNGNNYVVLAKYTSSGDYVWAYYLQSGCNGLQVDGAGNIYVLGTYDAATDLDPTNGMSYLQGHGYCIIKLNMDGSLLWAQGITTYSSSEMRANSLCLDANGNVYVTGGFEGTIDFGEVGAIVLSNETDFDPSDEDIFVAKCNANGSFAWAKQFSGTNVNRGQGNSVAVDPSGNIYIFGVFSGSVDFDPGNGTSILNTGEVFITKLDNSGSFVWAKELAAGLNYNLFAEYISSDDNGNIYLAGLFEGVVDFDPNSGTYNLDAQVGGNPFFCKIDGAGNLVWAKHFQSTEIHGFGYLGAYKVDGSGNFYISSDFSDELTLDANHTIINSDGSIYTCKLNPDGNLLWVDQYGSGGNTDVYAIAVDQNALIYAVGPFYSTTDFEPGSGTLNLSSNFNADAYFLKRNQGQSTVGIQENNADKIGIYPNPAFDVLNIEAKGDYTVKIYTMQGQLIQTHEANNPTRLDVSGLAQGVYMAAIENGLGISRISFIKQ